MKLNGNKISKIQKYKYVLMFAPVCVWGGGGGVGGWQSS